MKSARYEDIVDKAALIIKDNFKNQDNVQAWLPHIPEEEQDSVKFPDSVTRFLHTLLTALKTVKIHLREYSGYATPLDKTLFMPLHVVGQNQ